MKQSTFARRFCVGRNRPSSSGRDRAPSYSARAHPSPHAPRVSANTVHTMKGVRVRPESPEPTATQPAHERDGGGSPRASASASTSPGAPVGPEQPASGPAPPEVSSEPPARLSNGSASMTSGKVDMVDASPKRCSERKSVWHPQVNTQGSTGGGGPA